MAEAFRRADNFDLLLKVLPEGIPRDYVREVEAAYPNTGLQRRLFQLTIPWVLKHPWNPLPMIHR